MFSWIKKKERAVEDREVYNTVVQGLKSMYFKKILPVEKIYDFHKFFKPELSSADFDAKPMILLIGQYSTGKTTFIRYLLESDFPGMRVGPEPTTDVFTAVMYGDTQQEIPGNALVVDSRKQFQGLADMGNQFLNRLEASMMPNPVLKQLTLIDTPGILSGEKQRLSRGYDFCEVVEWFAERSDRIILLFDAHKLDISDEFRNVIQSLTAHVEKIRIVLNKADRIDSQQLMKVYGALMWSLGRVINSPEGIRVYIGSFWAEPLIYDTNRKLFELEEADLFNDLQSLPFNAAQRKLNDLIKRARLVRVNAILIGKLKAEMPTFGKDKRKQELLANLKSIYQDLAKEHKYVSIGDFPEVDKMQEILKNADFKTFKALRPELISELDNMFEEDVRQLLEVIRREQQDMPDKSLKDGAFSTFEGNPFGAKMEGINAGKEDPGKWIVEKYRSEYDKIFKSLGPVDNKLAGAAAKEYMMTTKMQTNILGKIWKMADINQDGFLDKDEFALALYLIRLKQEGHELPSELPRHLIPLSHRTLF